jgi:hypothetical protein
MKKVADVAEAEVAQLLIRNIGRKKHASLAVRRETKEACQGNQELEESLHTASEDKQVRLQPV